MRLTANDMTRLHKAYDEGERFIRMGRQVNGEDCMGCAIEAELKKKPAERNVKFIERVKKHALRLREAA